MVHRYYNFFISDDTNNFLNKNKIEEDKTVRIKIEEFIRKLLALRLESEWSTNI